ncbi:DUF5067 domain-containing protein [Lactococcus lactis]|uniref:DUF5067 domain-containing protein n=1 Tax=Lactococcus lactis subsp. lactis A12 TaxID=1137134 RepID=S6EPV4_LACLL|nr:DUF5067 domain-containing protein [Lactococcus lactis]CDG03385.1 Putative uncharacterized protein [Lactococcus lactis subsp. lactis A12]SBW31862.1 Uncharacterized protein LLA12_PIII00033 [Lactococcus lactis subsp. lactis]HEM9329432.1 DUF5067 domain-containing protein [Streptococcus agalactiae]
MKLSEVCCKNCGGLLDFDTVSHIKNSRVVCPHCHSIYIYEAKHSDIGAQLELDTERMRLKEKQEHNKELWESEKSKKKKNNKNIFIVLLILFNIILIAALYMVTNYVINHRPGQTEISISEKALTEKKVESKKESPGWDASTNSEKALTEKKVESKKELSGWDASTKTFTNKDGVLKIDKAEKSTNFDGKPALKVYFTLTNKRKEAQVAQSLFQEMARVQQKQENTSNDLMYAMMPFNETGSPQEENHLNNNINPNGTVSGFYPYVLENETDPIQILFQKDYQTVDKYEITLK